MRQFISKFFYIIIFILGLVFSGQAFGQSIIVNINTANQEQLETLPGIGPTKAKAILDYRALIGTFTSVEQLDNVSGIGPATLESIRPLVILVGPVEELHED